MDYPNLNNEQQNRNKDREEALMDKIYNETAGLEEEQENDQEFAEDDDNAVINDGETPGLTVPEAMIIPK